MSLEPPFLDPEYSKKEFWGAISDFGEGSNQWGPYKFLVTRTLVRHATLGDSEQTVKIKIGNESEGNLYQMGFSHLSECVNRSIKFVRTLAKIDGEERMWFVATLTRDDQGQTKEVREKKSK